MSDFLSVVRSSVQPLILVSPQAHFDDWATAVSLYLSLRQSGKFVSLVCPAKPNLPHQQASLRGMQDLKTEWGKNNVLVSFPYTETAVDAVSYAIDETTQQFHLTIKPKPGFLPLDTSQLTARYVGNESDVVVLVGVTELEEFGLWFDEVTRLTQSATTIGIRSALLEPTVPQLELTDQSCWAESLARQLFSAEMPLTAEMATNILLAIDVHTASLSSPMTMPQTFETVALLLRAGGERIYKSETVSENSVENQVVTAKPSDTTSIFSQALSQDKPVVSDGQTSSIKRKSGLKKAA